MEGHFQGEIEENFFSPKMCFHTLGGEGGGLGGVEKIHTFYFFFEGFPKYTCAYEVCQNKLQEDDKKVTEKWHNLVQL